jgi:hypothetical protein
MLSKTQTFPHSKSTPEYLANVLNIPMLQRFAKTLSIHKIRILAYYDFFISTGP